MGCKWRLIVYFTQPGKIILIAIYIPLTLSSLLQQIFMGIHNLSEYATMACQSSTRFCSTRFSDKTTYPKIRPEAIHSTFCDAVSMTQCFPMRPGSISSWTTFWQHLKSPGLLTSEFPLACSHRPQEGYWKVCFSGTSDARCVVRMSGSKLLGPW